MWRQNIDNVFTSQAEAKNFCSSIRELTGGLQKVKERSGKGTDRLDSQNSSWVVDSLCTCTPVNGDDIVIIVVQQGVCSSFDERRGLVSTPAVRHNTYWPGWIVIAV